MNHKGTGYQHTDGGENNIMFVDHISKLPYKFLMLYFRELNTFNPKE